MDLFWKAVGTVLIAAVLGLILGKDIALLLSMAVCAMGLAVAIAYLQPVLTFLQQIQSFASVGDNILTVLFKVLGIGLIGEIVSMVCSDAGMASFGKMLKILSCAGILWVSLPLFQSVLSLLQQILGEV